MRDSIALRNWLPVTFTPCTTLSASGRCASGAPPDTLFVEPVGRGNPHRFRIVHRRGALSHARIAGTYGVPV